MFVKRTLTESEFWAMVRCRPWITVATGHQFSTHYNPATGELAEWNDHSYPQGGTADCYIYTNKPCSSS